MDRIAGPSTVEHVTLHRAPTTVADPEGIVAWLRDRIDAEFEVSGRSLDRYRDVSPDAPGPPASPACGRPVAAGADRRIG